MEHVLVWLSICTLHYEKVYTPGIEIDVSNSTHEMNCQQNSHLIEMQFVHAVCNMWYIV